MRRRPNSGITDHRWIVSNLLKSRIPLSSLIQTLGRVDKVSDPQPDRRDENEAEEAIGGFVVSRG